MTRRLAFLAETENARLGRYGHGHWGAGTIGLHRSLLPGIASGAWTPRHFSSLALVFNVALRLWAVTSRSAPPGITDYPRYAELLRIWKMCRRPMGSGSMQKQAWVSGPLALSSGEPSGTCTGICSAGLSLGFTLAGWKGGEAIAERQASAFPLQSSQPLPHCAIGLWSGRATQLFLRMVWPGSLSRCSD